MFALVDDLAKVVGSGSMVWISNRTHGFGSRRLVRLTILGSANRLLPDQWGWHDGRPSLRWPNCFDMGCFGGLHVRETSGVGDRVFLLGFVDQRWWLSLGKMTTGSGGGSGDYGTGSSYQIRHWIRLWDPGRLWFRFEFLIQLGSLLDSFTVLGLFLGSHLYWFKDPTLWYLFERGRLPTWPCSYTLGRLRFSGGRVISILHQFDFRHFVR